MKDIQRIHCSTLGNFKSTLENLNAPIIVEGLCENWPVVQQAKISNFSFADYLKRHGNYNKAPTVIVDPNCHGHIGYRNEEQDFSFIKKEIAFNTVLSQLIEEDKRGVQNAGIALQSGLISTFSNDFLLENPSPQFLKDVEPRLWVSNRTSVPAHYDSYYNLAFVIGGKRTFYLFPINEIDNLYVGPIDNSPTGPVISMVNIEQPDLKRHPKFELAQKSMHVATLNPGEAIYIPPLWWHSVYATESINGLLNYWWGEDLQGTFPKVASSDALLFAILSIRALPKSQRSAWKTLFDYYVFGDKTIALQHLTNSYQGILREVNDENTRELYRWLFQRLAILSGHKSS
ncbi:hypothetical protein PALB_26320 [Pseudoalteromonas luteoviolacea B = ATCC 29581]|nr:hypothetical protein PALB_26320 [Pseudoalteromonas luteoviolacea B = ATCC 29581]